MPLSGDESNTANSGRRKEGQQMERYLSRKGHKKVHSGRVVIITTLLLSGWLLCFTLILHFSTFLHLPEKIAICTASKLTHVMEGMDIPKANWNMSLRFPGLSLEESDWMPNPPNIHTVGLLPPTRQALWKYLAVGASSSLPSSSGSSHLLFSWQKRRNR